MAGCRNLTDEEIKKIIDSMRGKYKDRNRSLFLLGVNTGYRISELLSLKLKDVVTENGEIVDEISIERRYMKKKLHGRTVAVNPGAREVILFWVSRLYEKGFRHKDTALFCKDNGKAISRIDAWKIINAAKKMAGLKGKIATHSMRKTYGTNAHAELMRRNAAGESIDVLLETADMLGHSDPKSTMSYLPRNPKRRREVINAISILPERTEES